MKEVRDWVEVIRTQEPITFSMQMTAEDPPIDLLEVGEPGTAQTLILCFPRPWKDRLLSWPWCPWKNHTRQDLQAMVVEYMVSEEYLVGGQRVEIRCELIHPPEKPYPVWVTPSWFASLLTSFRDMI